MNLWHHFPDLLAIFDGALSLPLFTLPIYLYLLYVAFTNQRQRVHLIAFLLLNLFATTAMLLNISSQGDTFYPPLLLLLVVVFAIFNTIRNGYQGVYKAVKIWLMATLVAILHCLSWSAWYFALAGS